MALEKINGSPLLRQGILDSSQQSEKATAEALADKTAAEGTGRPAGGAKGDTAEISDTARRLMELRSVVDRGRSTLEALPAVREEKIQAVKERLAAGYYQSPGVTEKVAGGVAAAIAAMDEI